jgi:hypothetical protein
MSLAAIMARPPDGLPERSPELAAAGILPRLALAATIVLQIVLILTHGQWRDELQALMLAQHSPSLSDLFAALHYEGHPSLWFLALRALTPFGHPTVTLKVLQLAIALSTIAIVWTRAPFGPWVRILILTGYLVLFEWGTIARGYSLAMLLYFAFLALNRRAIIAYLLLGLIANISAPSLMLAGASALLLFFVGKERSPLGVTLFAALCLVAVVTAWPADDAHTVMRLAHSLPARLVNAFSYISGALVPIGLGHLPEFRVGLLVVPVGAGVGMIAAVLGTLAVARNRMAAALFLLLFAGIFALSAFVYPTQSRHTGVIFLFLIGIEWLLVERGQGPISVLSRTWIAVLTVCGLWMSGWALALPFTAMQNVARAINERGLADAQWAAYPSSIGVEISARLGHPYFDLQRQCLAWFQKWNAASVTRLAPEAVAERASAAAAASGGRIMLVTTVPVDAAGLTLLEDFRSGLLPEPAWIYEVSAPPGASAAQPLRPCE